MANKVEFMNDSEQKRCVQLLADIILLNENTSKSFLGWFSWWKARKNLTDRCEQLVRDRFNRIVEDQNKVFRK